MPAFPETNSPALVIFVLTVVLPTKWVVRFIYALAPAATLADAATVAIDITDVLMFVLTVVFPNTNDVVFITALTVVLPKLNPAPENWVVIVELV